MQISTFKGHCTCRCAAQDLQQCSFSMGCVSSGAMFGLWHSSEKHMYTHVSGQTSSRVAHNTGDMHGACLLWHGMQERCYSVGSRPASLWNSGQGPRVQLCSFTEVVVQMPHIHHMILTYNDTAHVPALTACALSLLCTDCILVCCLHGRD